MKKLNKIIGVRDVNNAFEPQILRLFSVNLHFQHFFNIFQHLIQFDMKFISFCLFFTENNNFFNHTPIGCLLNPENAE